jgi:tetratricopeptide (TPR) repeat protein
MDLVAYSMLPMDEQEKVLHELQEAVRNTAHIGCGRPQDELICLPTGDGMALVFFGCPDSPAHCALELARALRQHPEIKLRMGIHTGPVYRVDDINAARNVAGGGINMAQRVMDCGDAGHILVSKAVADVLAQLSTWKNVVLQDLGEAEVKHGVHLHIFNLYADDAGNPALPKKLRAAHARARRRTISFALATILVLALAAGAYLFHDRQAHAITERDTLVLADFANHTGDPVFDDTLRTALSVSLAQSPFLNILSDNRVATTLKMMTKPADTKLTPEVARELCSRAGSKAYIGGSISSLGSQYVITLDAVRCTDGDIIARKMARATIKENILDALGDASTKLRDKLGESLATVQRFDVPLVAATTPSLEALKAYTIGVKISHDKGDNEGLPALQRAVTLDANFALAYASLGNSYRNLGQFTRAIENLRKAYDLRDRVSERERFYIESLYYRDATGQLDKAVDTFTQWVQVYPNDAAAHANLGVTLASLGQFEKAVSEAHQVVVLAPNNGLAYGNLLGYDVMLDRLDDAKATFDQALSLKLDGSYLREYGYALAFLRNDAVGMEEQLLASIDKPGLEDALLSLQSDTEAYYGRLVKAREYSERAVNAARHNRAGETAALWRGNEALREAEIHNPLAGRNGANLALVVNSGRYVRVLAALVLARSGDTQEAQTLADQLSAELPLNTVMQSYLLPTVRASIELGKRNPRGAIQTLQQTYEFERAQSRAFSSMYPVYIRGEAYLQAHNGPAAVAEFQKLLDHRGVVVNFVTGALAHLQLGRAYAMAGDNAKAKTAYQDFLTVWKNADPDIPIYKQAKAEYAKLQ